MQGIYTYIPETDHVPREYNVAAILSLLFMALISLAPYHYYGKSCKLQIISLRQERLQNFTDGIFKTVLAKRL
jgi:hypothetical protein